MSETNEQALRFVIAVESASRTQIMMAAVAATRSNTLGGLPLSGMMGSNFAAEDLETLGLIQRAGSAYSASEQGRKMIGYLDSRNIEPDTPPQTEELLHLVGKPSDPHFYAQVLSTLNNMDSVLLVDPYLAVADLNVITRVGKVSRVLTGPRPVIDRGESRNDPGARHVALRISAGTNPRMDVRISTAIHDRYALPASGTGYMMGASMGSRKVTALVELSQSATKKLLEEHSEIWSAAEKIDPIVAPAPGRPASRT
ncbi:hypothetical protein [Arthrobacter sp. UYCu723]